MAGHNRPLDMVTGALDEMVLTQWLADNSSIEPIEDKDINEIFAELKGEIIPL